MFFCWAGLAPAESDVPPAVELGPGTAGRFATPPPSDPAALERAWGQFELRLPVQGFPVAAPNCKDEIRLRWVALTPDATGRGAQLQARWKLLERIKALQATGSSAAPELLALDLRHYTRRNKAGHLQLQYCNAFVKDSAP